MGKGEKINRTVKEILQPNLLHFCKKRCESRYINSQSWRVYAGKISKDIENKSPQSHYFIQLKNQIDVDTFISKYNASDTLLKKIIQLDPNLFRNKN